MKKTWLVTAALLAFGTAAYAAAYPDDFKWDNAMLGATTFSHKSHSETKAIPCTDCHTALFPMARTTKITMADINAGKQCGACHKAESKAFAATECTKCHKK